MVENELVDLTIDLLVHRQHVRGAESCLGVIQEFLTS